MKKWVILFLSLLSCFEMSSQDLTEIYPIVLPQPNEGFENRYFDILDNGLYGLDSETRDATELIENSILPNLVKEIPKVGVDSVATEWVKTIYSKLLREERCLYDDEYWEIVKRLPDFYALEGSKQKMIDYVSKLDISTFLELMQGMPVYRLNRPNLAIPNYNLKGKGYHPESSNDWINFDKTALIMCANSLSEATKLILNKKYLKPDEAKLLIEELRKDINELKAKEEGNNPNGHLIIKYDIESRTYLYRGLIIHVLEDFEAWVSFWTSKGYPIGLNTYFLIDR